MLRHDHLSLQAALEGDSPLFERFEAILGAHKALPDQTSAEAVGLGSLWMAEHVLKVPGGSGEILELEFEEAESDLLVGRIRFSEHEDENHVLGRLAIVEGLSEPRVIITPGVQLEVVVRIVGHGCRIAMPIGAAAVVIGMSGRRVGPNPRLLSALFFYASKMERMIGHVVHVVSEEENRGAAVPEKFGFVHLTVEGKIDGVGFDALVE